MRCTFVILLLFYSSEAQVMQQSAVSPPKDTVATSSAHLDPQHSKVLAVFKNIEYGIQSGTVQQYETEFAAVVSITIGSGERGYFSNNQAASIVSGYFSERRSISFEFSRIHEKGAAPYATGRFVYVQKGNQESVQVYVSLKRQDSRWVIGQFNIY